MRKIIIKKNRHYPIPLAPFSLPIWVNKYNYTVISHDFNFTDSCMFDLVDADQHDVNKLFGFSIGYHHKTSFRFGWRPILKNNDIQIVAYEYQEGVRLPTMIIDEVKLNEWHNFNIKYSPIQESTTYTFNGNTFTNEVNIEKKYGLGYTLGVFFGGNEKAPHDITIYMK